MSIVARIAAQTQRDPLTVIGGGLSAVWLLLVGLFWIFAPAGAETPGGLLRLASLVGVVIPLVLIWMAVSLARAIADLRGEAEELRLRLSQMRDGGPARGSGTGGVATATPARPTTTATRTTAPLPRAQAQARPRGNGDVRQASMPLDTPPQPVSIAPQTLVLALNFPDGPDDTHTINALRAALKDQDYSRILRASQDVITLLAAQDVYMDDLQPDHAPVAIWRRLAGGTRGAEVAPIGGIRDPMALETTTALLRGDEIFRDAAHHFLRHFDAMLSRIVPELEDDEVVYLADSRSARAFMLLGRASGAFN